MKPNEPPEKKEIPFPVRWDEAVRQAKTASIGAKKGKTKAAPRLPQKRPEEIMDERAAALARVPPAAARASEVLEIATFALAFERYGIETRYVREVVRLTDYAPLPAAPPFLVGVVNLRGEILALIDLRTFFNLPARGLTDLARVLVLGDERAEFGVLADATHEVTTLRVDEIHEAPESASGVGREYLRGVTADALIVLDGAALLRDARLFIDQGDESGV